MKCGRASMHGWNIFLRIYLAGQQNNDNNETAFNGFQPIWKPAKYTPLPGLWFFNAGNSSFYLEDCIKIFSANVKKYEYLIVAQWMA